MPVKTAYTTVSLKRAAKDGDCYLMHINPHTIEITLPEYCDLSKKDEVDIEFKAWVTTSENAAVTPLSLDVTAPSTWTDTTIEIKDITLADDIYTVKAHISGFISTTIGSVVAENVLQVGIKVNATQTIYGEITLISTKEVKDGEDGQQGEVGASLRNRDEFSENNTYVWDSSFRDFCFKVTTADDGTQTPTFYVLKVKGSFKGSDYPLTNTDVWMSQQMTSLTATDILLTNNMYAKVMSVVNAKIEELLVKHLLTASQGARIDMTGTLMDVYGSVANSHNMPDIRFGLDENGYAILQFYKDGVLQYDLGSINGLRKIDEAMVKYSFTQCSYYLVTYPSTIFETIGESTGVTTIFHFNAGKTIAGYNAEAKARDGKYYKSGARANMILPSGGADGYDNYPDDSYITSGLYRMLKGSPTDIDKQRLENLGIDAGTELTRDTLEKINGDIIDDQPDLPAMGAKSLQSVYVLQVDSNGVGSYRYAYRLK